jgi:YVTN family beta-propeller protein
MFARPLVRLLTLSAIVFAAVAAESDLDEFEFNDHARLAGPSQSGPIAVSPDDRSVWVVNPDVNTVTRFDIEGALLRKIAEIPVGLEPRNLAISPNGKYVFVSNTASGTVSVIRTSRNRVSRTIAVGTEPYGIAITPNGSRVYVANARSNDISVLDKKGMEVIDTIEDVGVEPRALAITNDGDDKDLDEHVYVTQFLGFDRPGVVIGADDYKEARVAVISTHGNRVEAPVTLSPLANTGFRSNGSALGRIAAVDPPAFTHVTGASPNMLHSIALKGERAYVPNIGASADGPVRFNTNVQALLSVIDVKTNTEGLVAGVTQTINMNRGINFEPPGPNKIFIGVPWQLAFEHGSDEGYVVAAASNLVVKVVLDANGTPTINAPAAVGNPGSIVRILTGQHPTGIAVNSTDTRAYVANEVSRDVTVIDLGTDQALGNVRASDLPVPGTDAAKLLIGKALFNSSTGVQLPDLGVQTPLRLSNEGWSGCISCHPFGLTDGIVWIFGAGPRRTLPLNGTFNPHDPLDQKILNYSAIFDEVQDFENNIRGVSGGLGLITLADGVTQDPALNAFNPANTGRSALLDDLAFFVANGIRTPLSPLNDQGASRHARKRIREGRELFEEANCIACHAGGGWASSRRNYNPPPQASQIQSGQLVEFLKPVGTFDPAAVNEIRQNGLAPLGVAGFNPPSLLGAHALGPFLHNGSALTLLQVLDNVTHRSAGTAGVDRLADLDDRYELATFLASIDASTLPFPISGAPPVAQPVAQKPADAAAATAYRLEFSSANPSHGSVDLRYAVPLRTPIQLEIFDVQGRHLASLVKGLAEPGVHHTRWDGSVRGGARAPVGVYLARLETDFGVKTLRIVRED